MAPNGLAVEFMGLPGSGKSTLSRRVAEHLIRRGLAVTQPSYALAHDIPRAERIVRKARHVARELVTHPGESLVALWTLRRTRQRRVRDVFKMSFNWLLVTDLLRRRPVVKGIHLYDQGPLQALWSIGFGGAPGAVRRMADGVGERVPCADVVVIVRASERAVMRRLPGRVDRDSRLDAVSGDPEAVRRASERLEEVLGVLEGFRRGSRVARVIEVDNEADDGLEQTASSLAADVQFLFTPS